MFEDLRDQLSERATQTAAQIQDSTLYITIKERYEHLSPNVQKGIWVGAGALIVLFLISLPWSHLSSASDQNEDFAENRQLLIDLINADNQLKSTPQVPKAVPSSSLVAKINDLLTREKILPEQILGVKTKADIPKIVPKNAQASYVEASLAQLNLRQVVNLGHAIHQLDASTKLIDLNIQANKEDDHYFDVEYGVLSFGPPNKPVAKAGSNKKKPRGKKNNRKRNNRKRNNR